MICGSGGWKSRLAKAAGAEAAGQMGAEKVHAVVARSTFPSENVQNTPTSDHFWKLRCRKSARRCGAKHISKSTCTKHTNVGPLLEVAMSKKCTPLWREAHVQVKMYKTHQCRTTFGSCDVGFLDCLDFLEFLDFRDFLDSLDFRFFFFFIFYFCFFCCMNFLNFICFYFF